MINRIIVLSLLAACCFPSTIYAQESYQPSKVVYDVLTSDIHKINNILDRASLLQNIYGGDSFDASIIIMIHGDAIPLFSKKNKERHKFIKRANSLMFGEIIKFRLCQASARIQGFSAGDFYSFINLVPMADAEIIKLQNQGYAYIR